MKRTLFILLVLTVCGFCFGNAMALNEYEEGLELYQAGEFEQAKARFEEYLDTHPDDPNTLYYLGKLETDGIESQNYYRRLWIRHPEHPLADDALFAIAEYHYARGYYVTARGMFRNLLTLYPGSELAQGSQYWLAVTYLAVDRPDSARMEFRRFLRKYPHAHLADWALLSVADSYFVEQEFGKALKGYRRVVESPSGENLKSSALFRLGRCYEALGKRGEAEEIFDRVVEEFPRSHEASLVRGGETTGPSAQEAPEETGVEEAEKPKEPPQAEYTIQVGAFAEFENAQGLLRRLKAKGYQVELSSKLVGQTQFYLVWVGKFVAKDKAKALADRLAAEEGLEYRIVTR